MAGFLDGLSASSIFGLPARSKLSGKQRAAKALEIFSEAALPLDWQMPETPRQPAANLIQAKQQREGPGSRQQLAMLLSKLNSRSLTG